MNGHRLLKKYNYLKRCKLWLTDYLIRLAV